MFFFSGTAFSSTYKTDHHDITEILTSRFSVFKNLTTIHNNKLFFAVQFRVFGTNPTLKVLDDPIDIIIQVNIYKN